MFDRVIHRKIDRYSTLPLPKERYIPGKSERPTDLPGDTCSDELGGPLPENELFCYAIDLFNQGFYWEAHESWEHLWRPRKESPEGVFLKGLIQITASFVKRMQGNRTGEALLRESAQVYLRDSKFKDLFEENLFCDSFYRDVMILHLKEQ